MTIDRDASLLGRTPGLPEEHFAHDGLITKHPVRAVALAGLRPMPGELLWDLGTGAGSIAVDWCRTDPTCRAIGVEQRADRAANARTNAANLTLPGQFEVREGPVAELIADLPAPDAVFIGGGLTAGLAEQCLGELPPGGRLVVHAVTMEADVVIAALHADHGGELFRLGVENADRIGRLRGWKPARTITCWNWTKPPA
ncbi:MAG: precorrin-6Y C5,15-methyltransferase (decarboxylating) subunit CbiT [Propionibacteriaceae bacterium]|nr:precorrin-6Y C5,15-methyltransferase (decarboxylating) subunit CbiT [Propionibacteriaceae bacterium]